jgi:hypothetical protein
VSYIPDADLYTQTSPLSPISLSYSPKQSEHYSNKPEPNTLISSTNFPLPEAYLGITRLNSEASLVSTLISSGGTGVHLGITRLVESVDFGVEGLGVHDV